MDRASFDTPDGEDIEIDTEEVVRIYAGEEGGTTVIELEDGNEVTVAATQLEVVAELGLNPLEFIDPEYDDESMEDPIDEAPDE